MSKRSQGGFTLIEIMIVIGIIGILAGIAAPAYQNYTIRAQVSEGLTLADGWKTAIVEYYANNAAWPSQTDLPAMTQSNGKYESVTVNTGVIQIIYGGMQANPNISNAVLTIVPYTDDNDEVLWQCGSGARPPGNMASGANPAANIVSPQFALPAQYLPSSCHS
jgi:type IV pilus assembly protein PilA